MFHQAADILLMCCFLKVTKGWREESLSFFSPCRKQKKTCTLSFTIQSELVTRLEQAVLCMFSTGPRSKFQSLRNGAKHCGLISETRTQEHTVLKDFKSHKRLIRRYFSQHLG